MAGYLLLICKLVLLVVESKGGNREAPGRGCEMVRYLQMNFNH